jgi:hypothetical protein
VPGQKSHGTAAHSMPLQRGQDILAWAGTRATSRLRRARTVKSVKDPVPDIGAYPPSGQWTGSPFPGTWNAKLGGSVCLCSAVLRIAGGLIRCLDSLPAF